MPPPPIAVREQLREERFNGVWTQELNRVFADVAPYYDQANVVASLGLWDFLLRGFMDTMELGGRARARRLRRHQRRRHRASQARAGPRGARHGPQRRDAGGRPPRAERSACASTA